MPQEENKEIELYFLQCNGHPIRFVLGEACPCSHLALATFFPDMQTAKLAAKAHCNRNARVMTCSIKVIKAT